MNVRILTGTGACEVERILGNEKKHQYQQLFSTHKRLHSGRTRWGILLRADYQPLICLNTRPLRSSLHFPPILSFPCLKQRTMRLRAAFLPRELPV